MLRIIGLMAVTVTMVNGISAKQPMVPSGQAKELTPMERDHYVPESAPSRSEYTPMLPPSRGKSDETAGFNLLKFDRDFIPKITLPLGLAQLPGWVTR
jgi:hypothetical protein